MGSADDPVYVTPADQWAADIEVRCSAITQLMWLAADGNVAFEYEFGRVPAGWESLGATHASEVSYLFGTLDRGNFPQRRPSRVNATDRQVSEVMQQYWTNLDPGPKRWPATNLAKIRCMVAEPNFAGIDLGICGFYHRRFCRGVTHRSTRKSKGETHED